MEASKLMLLTVLGNKTFPLENNVVAKAITYTAQDWGLLPTEITIGTLNYPIGPCFEAARFADHSGMELIKLQRICMDTSKLFIRFHQWALNSNAIHVHLDFEVPDLSDFSRKQAGEFKELAEKAKVITNRYTPGQQIQLY